MSKIHTIHAGLPAPQVPVFDKGPLDWLRTLPANDNLPARFPEPAPLIPTMLLRWGTVFGVALSLPGDSRTPDHAFSQPQIFRFPLGIGRFGRTVRQAYSEFEEMVYMAGQILSIEMQIAEYKRLGNTHEVDRLKGELQQLHDQAQFISLTHPNMGRALKIFASASSGEGAVALLTPQQIEKLVAWVVGQIEEYHRQYNQSADPYKYFDRTHRIANLIIGGMLDLKPWSFSPEESYYLVEGGNDIYRLMPEVLAQRIMANKYPGVREYFSKNVPNLDITPINLPGEYPRSFFEIGNRYMQLTEHRRESDSPEEVVWSIFAQFNPEAFGMDGVQYLAERNYINALVMLAVHSVVPEVADAAMYALLGTLNQTNKVHYFHSLAKEASPDRFKDRRLSLFLTRAFIAYDGSRIHRAEIIRIQVGTRIETLDGMGVVDDASYYGFILHTLLGRSDIVHLLSDKDIRMVQERNDRFLVTLCLARPDLMTPEVFDMAWHERDRVYLWTHFQSFVQAKHIASLIQGDSDLWNTRNFARTATAPFTVDHVKMVYTMTQHAQENYGPEPAVETRGDKVWINAADQSVVLWGDPDANLVQHPTFRHGMEILQLLSGSADQAVADAAKKKLRLLSASAD